MNRFNRAVRVRSLAALTLALSGLLAIQEAVAATIDSVVPNVNVAGTSVTNVVEGASISHLNAAQSAQVNVDGGHISWLWLYGQSSAAIAGGDISWVQAYDQSNVTITGAQDISWLLLYGPDARAEIMGEGLQYSGGHLSGHWGDGSAFSFWALDGEHISDGVSALNVALTPTGMTLSVASVPEPATWALMGLGLLAIGAGARASKARRG